MKKMHEMSKEEYLKWSAEYQQKWREEHAEELAAKDKKQEEMAKETYIYTDKVNTMENGPATILYLFVMIGGTIFNDRILIWIAASVIYFSHIFRYKTRAKKWETKGKAEWEKRYYGEKSKKNNLQVIK